MFVRLFTMSLGSDLEDSKYGNIAGDILKFRSVIRSTTNKPIHSFFVFQFIVKLIIKFN